MILNTGFTYAVNLWMLPKMDVQYAIFY